MKKTLLFLLSIIALGAQAQTLAVSPNTGELGETLQVTIVGQNTNFTQISGTSGIWFYNSQGQQFQINSFNPVSATEVSVNLTIPLSVSPGLYNLGVFEWNGNESYLPNAFNVNTNLNTIEGTIRNDMGGNGCDGSDPPAGYVAVQLSDGLNVRTTFTNSAGHYIFYVPAGTYTVTPQVTSTLFASSPAFAPVSFATQNNLSQTVDFCVGANGVQSDMRIDVYTTTPARPGFDATYRVVFRNAGNQILSGTAQFTYDDTRLDFVSATTAPASQTTGSLTWNYFNLLPFQYAYVDVVLNVNSPMETPAVVIGDQLPFTATVNPIAGDITPTNNELSFNQSVVGSYDPNDKSVTEGAQVQLADADRYLHYLIRFQNSGNFAAENVRVKDVLSANLDVSTLEIVSASHPFRSTVTGGNQLEFFFDNIQLPPESEDEPGSHGFVAFKIKPTGIVEGTTVNNTAEIYFDFNFPIVTNTVSTAYTVLATKQFSADDNVKVYPNPVSSVLNVQSDASTTITSVKIFNQLGQLVKVASDMMANRVNAIAVSDLQAGTYLVQIDTDKRSTTKKLIKY